MADLIALYKWFDKNRASIIEHHTEEYVLLRDNTVEGYFPDDDAALEYAEKNGFIPGEFLIQDCITKEQEYIGYFNRNIEFVI
jgi:hypothetical protein